MPRLRQAFIVALIVAVVYCWAPPARGADWTEVMRKEIEPTPGYGAFGSAVGWTFIYEIQGDRYAVHASRLAPANREAEDARLVFITADGKRHVATCIASSYSPCSETTVVASGLHVNPEGCRREEIRTLVIEQLTTEGLEKILAEQAARERAVEAARQACPLPMPVVGQPFPFTLTAIDGETLTSQGLKGKVVVLDFWANWCRPCVAELPALKQLYQKHREKGLMIIGLSYDGDKTILEQGILKHQIPWPQVLVGDLTKQQAMNQQMGIRGIPQYFVIDRQGILRTTQGRGALETLVPELLATP